MKKTIAGLLLLLITVPAVRAEAPIERFVAPAGGFSVWAPPGWRFEERAGNKYKLAFGPASEVFVANLNFRDDASTLPLKEYVTASVEYLLKNYKETGATSFKLVSRAEVVTDTRERGEKLVYLCEFKGLRINSTQYYFDARDKKLILTFTALEAEKATNDRLFDNSARSLVIDH